MMKILQYTDLNITQVKKQFEKTLEFLFNSDFHSAEIKKLTNTDYYRARLDYENRLLFKFAKYRGETYILLLEVILNHEYDKSRFLRGVKVDENKLVPVSNEKSVAEKDKEDLRFINQAGGTFHLLDKIISFDEIQNKIFSLKPPVIIIGSAGSGKTVLTLEKVKQLKGNILYVTLSPFLVENSSKLYFSNNYENEKQDIDFLSFKEFLETIHLLPGNEIDRRIYNEWIQTRKHTYRIKDSYKLFEEFKGVLTGFDITKPYLSKEDYLGLGVRQTIFLDRERENVYEAFLNYLGYMKENMLYDLNIIAYHWLYLIRPKYDFIVIDEVQDFTNIQLNLILKSLKTDGNFILCGDSNQIVHPNFFSWTSLKSMFYKHDIVSADIQLLRTNYRNSVAVTELANRLLILKNARFGSLDKESTFLIDTISENKGEVKFYKDSPKIRSEFNEKTFRSTKYAVIVLDPDEKPDAKNLFRTPLVFSIYEAKGLEYENIILLNFVSKHHDDFQNITRDISEKDIDAKSFNYSRGKDKTDKDIDTYKFYINALYVGLTRAVRNLYIIESSPGHTLFRLLSLVNKEEKQVSIKTDTSSSAEWQAEARKLEMQGKKEQADEIRKNILSIQKPDWEPITPDNLDELKIEALNPEFFNKKAKDKLFAFAMLYDDHDSIIKLSEQKYRRADDPEREKFNVFRRYYQNYIDQNIKAIEANIRKYGPEYRDQFNLTPLLAALFTGSLKVIEYLAGLGVNFNITDHSLRTPLQILIFRASEDARFMAKFENLYPIFKTDFIKVKTEDKLIKIDNRKMEYLLINVFIALQKGISAKYRRFYDNEGVSAKDLVSELENWPDSVLPDYRKKRNYISSILAKNEIDSNDPYNRKLFLRTDRGLYFLQPELEILLEEKWINVYDILKCKKPKKLSYVEKEILLTEKFILDLKKDKQQAMNRKPYIDASYLDALIVNHTKRIENLKKLLNQDNP